MRRRPKRSPSAAPLRMRTPKERMYASTIHSRLPSEPCRLRWLGGRGGATTRGSGGDIKSAAPVTARTAAARRGEVVMVVPSSELDAGTREGLILVLTPPPTEDVRL